MSKPSFPEIIQEATDAALAAFRSCQPTPMGVVGYPTVMDGVCGFAWIIIKPARGPLVAHLKKEHIGEKSIATPGWRISSYDAMPGTGFSQSMERKRAGCDAFVAVLKKHIPNLNAYAESRMD